MNNRRSGELDFVTGAEKLDEPMMPPRGNKRHYFPGMVLGNRFYIGDKPFGMEPGSLVVQIDEALIKKMIQAGIIQRSEKEFENSLVGKTGGERERAMIVFLTAEMEKLHKELDSAVLQKEVPEKEYLEQAISQREKRLSNELKKLFAFTQQLQVLGKTGAIKQALIKQDYMDTSISPPTDRLSKTTRGKSLSSIGLSVWKRGKEMFSSRKKENANALGEAFANAVARGFAMPAQNQYVLLSKYENGDLKIMTDCEWQQGLVGMTDQVAGKKYQGNYIDEKSKRADGKYDSAIHRLDCAGQNLALMLIQADDDGFGSKLQNKMILGKELFGIDFGHAYRSAKNPLVDNLTVDFTLDDKTLSQYKNFSILLDAPPTDQMLGVFYTYRSMDEFTRQRIFGDEGMAAVEKAILDYKKHYQTTYPQFAEKIDKITPGCVDIIKDEYEHQLQARMHEMLIEINKLLVQAETAVNPEKSKLKAQVQKAMECVKELQNNIEGLQEKAALHNACSEKMLETFKDRLKLAPEQLLLLNNLAKLTSTTRETDKDGVVVLKHLQIEHNKNRVTWNIQSNEAGMVNIHADVNQRQSAELTKVLLRFLQQHGNISNLHIDMKNGVNIRLPVSKLPELMAACHEDRIRAYKNDTLWLTAKPAVIAQTSHFRMFDHSTAAKTDEPGVAPQIGQHRKKS